MEMVTPGSRPEGSATGEPETKHDAGGAIAARSGIYLVGRPAFFVR